MNSTGPQLVTILAASLCCVCGCTLWLQHLSRPVLQICCLRLVWGHLGAQQDRSQHGLITAETQSVAAGSV